MASLTWVACSTILPILAKLEPPVVSASVGEPLIATLVVATRQESGTLLLPQGWDGGVTVSVTYPERKTETHRHYLRLAGGMSTGAALVFTDSGEARQDLLLNEWFAPRSPGSFVLTVNLDAQVLGGDSSGPKRCELRSEEIKLVMRARDTGRLREVAQRLVEKVRASRGDERRTAVRALAFVEDRSAVPKMIDVLTSVELDREESVELLRGLGRLGGEPAAEFLLGMADDRGARIRYEVYHALSALRGSIERGPLASRVDEAIAALRHEIAGSWGDAPTD